MTAGQWYALVALSLLGCLVAWLLLRSVGALLDELDEYHETPYK